MSFSIIHLPGHPARVTIEGNLDCATMSALRREVTVLLDVRPAFVALDLSRLRFVDASGLGMLLSFIKRLYAQGGALALSCLDDQPVTLLELLRMAHVDTRVVPATELAPPANRGRNVCAVGPSPEAHRSVTSRQ